MNQSSKYTYEDNLQKRKYNIELSFNSNGVSFNVKEENIYNKEYEASFTLTTLIEKNNIFKLCNTSEDCYNYFLKLLNNKKYKIIDGADKITIAFLIKNLITEKDEEVKLDLNSKTLEINSIIENYNAIIKDLKNENTTLKEEISKLKEISQEFKLFKEQINRIIDERVKYLQQKEKEKEKLSELNKSSILSGADEKLFFQNLIECQNLKLIYRLSRDGYEPSDFHRFCDNKGATLTLFKSQNNRKFGGYLSKNWESSGDWKKDNNVFLFSVDLKRKYQIKNNINNCYYCHKDLGPLFGNFGFFYFKGNLLDENKCKEYDLSNDYQVNQGYQKYEISGNEKILCKDIEVYQIEF